MGVGGAVQKRKKKKTRGMVGKIVFIMAFESACYLRDEGVYVACSRVVVILIGYVYSTELCLWLLGL